MKLLLKSIYFYSKLEINIKIKLNYICKKFGISISSYEI